MICLGLLRLNYGLNAPMSGPKNLVKSITEGDISSFLLLLNKLLTVCLINSYWLHNSSGERTWKKPPGASAASSRSPPPRRSPYGPPTSLPPSPSPSRSRGVSAVAGAEKRERGERGQGVRRQDSQESQRDQARNLQTNGQPRSQSSSKAQSREQNPEMGRGLGPGQSRRRVEEAVNLEAGWSSVPVPVPPPRSTKKKNAPKQTVMALYDSQVQIRSDQVDFVF